MAKYAKLPCLPLITINHSVAGCGCVQHTKPPQVSFLAHALPWLDIDNVSFKVVITISGELVDGFGVGLQLLKYGQSCSCSDWIQLPNQVKVFLGMNMDIDVDYMQLGIKRQV